MYSRLLSLVAVALLFSVAVAQDDADKIQKKMNGTWTLISGEVKGEKLPAEVVKTAKLVLKGDMHTVKVGDALMVGTHKVDVAKKPWTIDVTDAEGPFKGKTLHGIWKLEDGQFTICIAPPGADRPTEFNAKSPSVMLLHVWKKKTE